MSLEPLEVMRGYKRAERQGEALSLGLVKSAVAYRFSALRQPETRLPLVSHSQARDGLPERLVLDLSIDLGCRNVSVTERSLHQTEVASLAEEPHGKGMAQRVDGKVPGDASCFKPVPKSQLDLARAKPIAAAGAEERTSIASIRSIDVQTEESAKRCVQEDRLFTSTFGSDSDDSLAEVHVPSGQSNQGAESHAGAEQEREHRVVSFGNGGVGVCDRAEQSFRLVGRQIARHSPIRWCRTDQPCGVVAQVPCVGEKSEEDPECSLGSVDSECRHRRSVTIGKEARERVGSDDADLDIALEPSFESPQIPQVSLPRALALAICPELRVEALDSCRELHGFTSLQFDSQATSMNALCSETVNSIMRTTCLSWSLTRLICLEFASVDATQAVCGPISEEVAIYA